MKLQEHVPLAPHTTLGVGGAARFFARAETIEDVRQALALARERALSLFPLGGGSNVLVADAGVEGIVLKLAMRDIAIEEDAESVRIVAGAGTLWEDVVEAAAVRGAYGAENLAGIPGTLGGAVVQNIGAYGAELSSVFEYADAALGATGALWRFTSAEAAFGYRASAFKENRALIVVRVALRFDKRGAPNLAYPDLARAAAGVSLATPADIARAVRAIRALKFPPPALEGSAGSFFKNPVVSREFADSLIRRFPGLPAFPQAAHRAIRGGDAGVKISLAWLLDSALSLKGFSRGGARLYERQPLVIVTSEGATTADIEALAADVEARVLAATGIAIEREVEMFGAVEK